jgi:hypothetical protein
MKTTAQRITAPRTQLPRDFPAYLRGTEKANGVSEDSTPGKGGLRDMMENVLAAIQEEKA